MDVNALKGRPRTGIVHAADADWPAPSGRGRLGWRASAGVARGYDGPDRWPGTAQAEFAALSRSGRVLHVMLENDRTEALDVLLITGLEQESPLPV